MSDSKDIRIMELQQRCHKLQAKIDELESQRNWLLRRVIINRHSEVALADAGTKINDIENLRRLQKILTPPKGAE